MTPTTEWSSSLQRLLLVPNPVDDCSYFSGVHKVLILLTRHISILESILQYNKDSNLNPTPYFHPITDYPRALCSATLYIIPAFERWINKLITLVFCRGWTTRTSDLMYRSRHFTFTYSHLPSSTTFNAFCVHFLSLLYVSLAGDTNLRVLSDMCSNQLS